MMNRLFLTLIFALTSLTLHAEIVDISNGELNELIKKGVPVIDIRMQQEWEQTGIINGSKLLTFFDRAGRSDPALWLQNLKPIAKQNQPVILICRTGNRTRIVSQFLSQQAGYAKVYNVKDGIMGWLKEKNPVITADPAISACKAAKTC